MTKISIVGATTWGTTLAIVNAIGNQENEIFLLTRSQDETTKLENENQNSKFLPGYSFPNNINITNSQSEALENTDLVILAVPSITFRENLTNIKDFISSNSILLSATKGIEISSGLRMTQIIKNEISNVSDQNICVLSGPNLAKEIIQGKPCSSVVASSDENTINTVQEILKSELFSLTFSNFLKTFLIIIYLFVLFFIKVHSSIGIIELHRFGIIPPVIISIASFFLKFFL